MTQNDNFNPLEVAWQNRREKGYLKALVETTQQILLKPNDFFDKLQINNSLADPYLFYLIMFLAPFSVSSAINKFIFQKEMLPGGDPSFTTGVLVGTVVFGIVGVFLWVGLMHLFVLLLGGKGRYIGTFNVLCYSAASQVLSIIPFVGPWVAGIWGLVVTVMGYKKVHQLSTGKAVLAVALLFIIFFILGFGLAIMIPLLMGAGR